MNLFKKISDHMIAKPEVYGERLPTFYPSSASCLNEVDNSPIGSCLREQWYRCMGYAPTNTPGPYSQWIFEAGNMWEDVIIEKCKQLGIWVTNSLKWVNKSKYISGKICPSYR